MSHFRLRRASTALGFWLCVAGLACLPLAQGGHALPFESGFTAICILALLLTWPGSHSVEMQPGYRMAWLSWWAWLLWQALQIMPLPADWVWWLSPKSAGYWQFLTDNGIPSPYRISIVPAQGLATLNVSVGLFCLWICLIRGMQQRPSRRVALLWAITLATLFQALYGTLAEMLNWTLALLEPEGFVHQTGAHGSFANRNHFAAYLTLGAAGCLALLLGGGVHKSPGWISWFRRTIEVLQGPGLFLRSALLAMVIAVVLSRSRMGNTSLAIGISVFAFVWILRTRTPGNFAKVALLFLSVAVLDVALISERFGLQRVIERIETTQLESDSRATARKMSAALIEQFGIAGSGLGSFNRLEHGVRPDPGVGRYVHAHNDHQQFILESGWVGYAILCCLLGSHFVSAGLSLRLRQSTHAACGAAFLMAATAALIHALVEFNFQIPAWRATFVALMALAVTPVPRRRSVSIGMAEADKQCLK